MGLTEAAKAIKKQVEAVNEAADAKLKGAKATVKAATDKYAEIAQQLQDAQDQLAQGVEAEKTKLLKRIEGLTASSEKLAENKAKAVK